MSTPTQTSSLTEFVHDVFIEVFFSPSEAISEAAFHKNWSRSDIHENQNGTHLSYNEFDTVLKTMRRTITNRKLVSESFVVGTPASDPTGQTGTVAHTSVFTGIQDGAEITGTIVAVMKVQWVQSPYHGRHRVFVSDTFVLAM
ncbi:hypothetical protein B0H10DRAFT_1961589 [Mycena sp. CBHHK59/15]|nr:hypothetical protein B0H10DRAFT_1961589 [Mycena sp. CBHHK59/15]